MSNFTSLPPAPGGTFYQNSSDVFLTTDENIIVTKGFARFNLYSDSTDANSRPILLLPTDLEGQQITLILQSGDSTTCILSTTSTPYIRISDSWTPTQFDQITLQWSKGLWIQVTASDSTPGGFTPVITDATAGDILIYSGTNWNNHQVTGQVVLGSTGVANFPGVSAPITGNAFLYNGTTWSNHTILGQVSVASNGISTFTHVSAPTTGQLLTFDGTNWVNKDPATPTAPVWVPIVAETNWISSAFITVLPSGLYCMRGSFSTSGTPGANVGTLPAGFTISGEMDFVSAYSVAGPAAPGIVKLIGNVISVDGAVSGSVVIVDGINLFPF